MTMLANILFCVFLVVLSAIAIALLLRRFFPDTKPVVVDGWLYVTIAVSGAAMTYLGEDSSYKYLDPYFIFYAKGASGLILQAANALKMFRSTGYAQHLEAKRTGNTQFIKP